MNTIDIIILFLLVIGTFSGYRKGLFIGLLSIVAFFVAIILGFRFMHWGAEILAQNVESFTFMLPFVAFIIIFFLVTITLRIVAYMIKKAIDFTLLGSFDNLGGAVLGFFKWAFMISLLFWVGKSFEYEIPESRVADAVVYPWVAPIAPATVQVLETYTPMIDHSINSIRKLVEIDSGAVVDR
ncbi:CvpA family protein [Litoribacter populi]|uniref:CvpA family protein n=1 Tax=Litoribacter populi TaxID=2598460 RepID=UPI00117FC437|nr:CvpA family protein [Litoribacter populi]